MEETMRKLYRSLMVSVETHDRLKVFCAEQKTTMFDFLERFLNEKIDSGK